jgi:hypothetical protein
MNGVLVNKMPAETKDKAVVERAGLPGTDVSDAFSISSIRGKKDLLLRSDSENAALSRREDPNSGGKLHDDDDG